VKLSLRHVSIRNDWKVHSSFYVCMKYYCLSYLYTFFLNGYLYTIKCSLVQHICNIFLENPFILPPFDTIGIFVYFSINCRLVQHIILKNIMYISCFLILFFLYLKYHWFCSFNWIQAFFLVYLHLRFHYLILEVVFVTKIKNWRLLSISQEKLSFFMSYCYLIRK